MNLAKGEELLPQPLTPPLPARQQVGMHILATPFPIRDLWSGGWRGLVLRRKITTSTNWVADEWPFSSFCRLSQANSSFQQGSMVLSWPRRIWQDSSA